MFERFTDGARRVVMRSQEEARVLEHNFIGTEHLLLALLSIDGVAAEALAALPVTRDRARQELVDIVGPGRLSPSGHIPFTPRSKKAMEFALREALTEKVTYVSERHLLLGVIRVGGVGSEILNRLGVDETAVRRALDSIAVTDGEREGAKREDELRVRFKRGRRWKSVDPEAARYDSVSGLPLSEQVRAAMEVAATEAVSADDNVIQPHALMLGLIAMDSSPLAELLRSYGVDLDQLRADLHRMSQDGGDDQ